MPNELVPPVIAPVGYGGDEQDEEDFTLEGLTNRLLGNKIEGMELGSMLKYIQRQQAKKEKEAKQAKRAEAEGKAANKEKAAAPRGMRSFAPIAGMASDAGSLGPMGVPGVVPSQPIYRGPWPVPAPEPIPLYGGEPLRVQPLVAGVASEAGELGLAGAPGGGRGDFWAEEPPTAQPQPAALRPLGSMGLIRGAGGELRERDPRYDVGYMPPAIGPVPGRAAARASSAPGVFYPAGTNVEGKPRYQRAGMYAEPPPEQAAAQTARGAEETEREFAETPVEELVAKYGFTPQKAQEVKARAVANSARAVEAKRVETELAGQGDTERAAVDALRRQAAVEEGAQVIQGINDPASVAARMGSMPQQAMGDSWAQPAPWTSPAGPIPPEVDAVHQYQVPPSPRQMMPRPGGEFTGELSVPVPGTSIEKVGEGAAERYVNAPSAIQRGIRRDSATGRMVYESPDVEGKTRAGYGTTFDWATGKATTPAAGQERRKVEIAAAKAETAAREAAAVAARPQPPTPSEKLAATIIADEANLARVTTPHRRVQAEHVLARKKDSLLGMGMSQVRKEKTPEQAEALGDKLANDWATPLGSASRQLAEYGTKRARELDMDLGITAATKGYAQFETDMAGAEKSHRAKWMELAHSYMAQENRQRESEALATAQALAATTTGAKPTRATFTPMTLDEAYRATRGAAEGYRVGATPSGDVLPDLQVKALKRAGLTDEEALALSEAAVDMGATTKERRRAQQFVLATKRSPKIDLAGIKDFLKKRQVQIAVAPAVAKPVSAATPADAAEIIRQGQTAPAPVVPPVAAAPTGATMPPPEIIARLQAARAKGSKRAADELAALNIP